MNLCVDNVCVCFSGVLFISPAAEQARQSISASASKHKWSAVLIASCLPHELPDRRREIMEGVGTAQALLPPFYCVASILTSFKNFKLETIGDPYQNHWNMVNHFEDQTMCSVVFKCALKAVQHWKTKKAHSGLTNFKAFVHKVLVWVLFSHVDKGNRCQDWFVYALNIY